MGEPIVSRSDAVKFVSEVKTSFGRRLAAWRAHRDLSQMELAFHSSVSLSTLVSYEAGRRWPVITKAEALARVLGITVHEMMHDDPPKKSEEPAKKKKPPG